MKPFFSRRAGVAMLLAGVALFVGVPVCAHAAPRPEASVSSVAATPHPTPSVEVTTVASVSDSVLVASDTLRSLFVALPAQSDSTSPTQRRSGALVLEPGNEVRADSLGCTPLETSRRHWVARALGRH